MGKLLKLVIVTCCLDDWGGSEELWAKSIPFLKAEGIHDITVFKNTINRVHPEWVKLEKLGVKFRELEPHYTLLKGIGIKLKNALYRIYDKLGLVTYNWNKPAELFYNKIKQLRPDLVLVSQAINFDGLVYANQCYKLNIPYTIVSHKAVDFYWPQASERVYMRDTMVNARKCLFVSAHTRRVTEEQFAVKLTNSDLVFNPVKTHVEPLPFPDVTNGYRLACIGRLFVLDKGQDMLLRILAQPKWRERDITLVFIGTGPDLEGLTEMAKFLQLNNVKFAGYMGDLKGIWTNHHALIMPSRSEGLPLTIIEAMSLGRPVITTNAGGNNEIIQNGVTGFVGEANEFDFEKTMDMAWAKREEWAGIGIKAAQYIADTIPECPERLFAYILMNSI